MKREKRNGLDPRWQILTAERAERAETGAEGRIPRMLAEGRRLTANLRVGVTTKCAGRNERIFEETADVDHGGARGATG